MAQISYNCIVCAQEFGDQDLINIKLSKLNKTPFKICQLCLDKSDPADDYQQARAIINNCFQLSEALNCFSEVQKLLKSIKK